MIWLTLLLMIGLWFGLRALPCPAWLAWMVEMDNPFCREARSSTILGRLSLVEGMSVLDFGCGPGRLTHPAATAVGEMGRVVALDLQPAMLERVRAKVGQNVDLVLADRPLAPSSFDRALLVTVLGEVPDRPATLQRIYDALRPEGILSITETLFDPHYLRKGTVRALARSIGFEEAASFGGGMAYTLHFKKPN